MESTNEDSHKIGWGQNEEAFRKIDKDGLVEPWCPVYFYLHSHTEILSKRNAVEVLANTTLIDWDYIEHKDKQSEQHYSSDKADNDPYQLVSTVLKVEGYIWHKTKSKEKAINESKQVSKVVNHWKETDNEQCKQNRAKLE